MGMISRMKRPLLTTPNFSFTLITFVGSVVPMVVAKFPIPPVTPSPSELPAAEGLNTSELSIPPPYGDSGPAPGGVGVAEALRSSNTVP